MRVIPTSGPVIELGTAEINPTVGMIDYSRRVTDDFGVTTVVKRGFARKISARVMMPFDQVSAAQVSLAALRAQSARWEFDPDYDWLDFDGFYREFDLDLAVPPNSFCTLSVEGLAETEAGVDDGSDPSPQDVSTLIVVDPVAMTDAVLVSTNVPENDYPAWAAGTTYALGARVIKAATHRIYESAGAGNVGNDPAVLSGHWFDIGPTNRWAMFDQALGTATTRSGGMTLQLAPGSVGAIALLDVAATSVRVQNGGFDQTKSAVTGSVSFLDLPTGGGTITVTITGSGTVSVGTLLTGPVRKLGKTGEAPSAGITDFSRKDVDGFGAATIVERAWAKRMQARALISTTSLDKVANRIAHLRATPAFWVADDGTEALTIYGFFKEFSIEVGQNVSTLSLSVEGLSKAAYVAPAADILDVAEKKIFVPLETARQHNIGDLVARGAALAATASSPAPLNALISALTASNTIWLLFRNAITPSWDDVTAPSARDYTTWLTLNNAVDDAIPALQRGISEEDARRASVDPVTGNLIGDGTNVANGLVANALVPIGSFSVIRGNTVSKVGGTHGAFQGGAVGTAFVNTAFVSSSLLNVAAGQSWETHLSLDDEATSFAVASLKVRARYTGLAAGSGVVSLFVDNVQVVGPVAVFGLTAASRMMLAYDGVRYFVIIDGVIRCQVTAPANLRLWPKVIDYYSGLTITDVQYGAWTDNAWASISGSPNAPADNATSGDNFIKNPVPFVDSSGWVLDRAIREIASAGDPVAAYFKVAAGGTGGLTRTERMRCSSSKLFISSLYRSGVAGAQFQLSAWFFDATGAFLSNSLHNFFPATANVWRRAASPVIDVPAGAAEFYIEITGYGTGEWKWSAVYASTSQFGATVGAVLGGNLVSGVGGAVIAPEQLQNSSLILNADGTASYWNGTSYVNIGAVTINGLGYSGDLNATYGAATDANGVLIGSGGVEVDNNLINTLVSPAGRNFTANQNGVLDQQQLPATFQFKLLRGAVDVSSTTTWTVTAQPGVNGGTVTIANGILTIPTGCTIGTSSSVSVSALRNGVTRYGTVSLTRTDAAPPQNGGSSGGTTGSDNSLTSVNSTTLVAISDEIEFSTGAAGVATFSGLLNISAPAQVPAGVFGARLQWKVKPTGGSYSNAGSLISENYAASVQDNGGYYTAETGEISAATSQSGLAANTVHFAQLFARRDIATVAKTIGFGPSVSVTGT